MNRYVGLIESINPIILQLQLKYALKNNFKVFFERRVKYALSD